MNLCDYVIPDVSSCDKKQVEVFHVFSDDFHSIIIVVKLNYNSEHKRP